MGEGSALLDTSVWIHYFRPEGPQKLKTAVKNALIKGQVVSCWVVKMEILVGARDEGSFNKLLEHLIAISDVPIDEAIWKEAARLGYRLRKKGLTIPLPDLVIAQAAIAKDVVLWHVDEHFEEIRRVASLRTKSFLPLT